MKKIFVFILLICLSCLFGCEKVSDSFKTSGDFIYEVVQINEEGKDIKQKGIKNKNVVETFVRIRGLSEEGKTKEIIVVPQYIDEIEVKEIGFFGMPRGNWNTRVLKKVYIPFMPKLINNVIPINNIIVLTNVVPDDVKLYDYIYITSYYHEKGDLTNFVPEVYGEHHHMCRYANVSFMYNYDEAPNSGYYWIDDCDYGTNITYIPANPTRDGYIFDGWYKEAECINKWDFDTDKLPEEINPGDHSNSYQETILYAKWIDESIKNREESQAKIELAYSRYVLDRVFTDYGYYNIYKDNYAGMYLDEKGLLSVELVEGMNNEEDIEFLTENNISYSFKKFSYNYMQNIMISVNDIAVEAGLVSAGIEEKENHVLIEMNKVDKVDYVIDYLKEQGLYDSEAVVIHADEKLGIVLNSREIHTGEVSYKYLSNTQAIATTICTNAVKNSTGELGVITCGHLGSVDTEIYYDKNLNDFDYSIHLGIISDSMIGNSIDGAFIPFETQGDWVASPYAFSNNTYTNILLGTDSQIAVGSTIARIGQTSGYITGTITSINQTHYLNGYAVSNSFRISNPGEAGDSGGPIYYSNNGNLYLIGLYYGNYQESFNNRGVGCKISSIMSQFGVTPITNDSFNTTNLASGTIQLNGVNFNISGAYNIPSSVKGSTISQIGTNAFYNYSSLNNVKIPNSITSIGNYAFNNCSSLSEVIIEKANLPLTTLGSSVFSGCSLSLQIKVPNDRIADYKNMTNWSTYSNKIVPFTNDFTTINMTSSTNTTQTLTLDAGYNKLYKLNVVDQGTYDVRASTSANTTIKLYDSNYNLLETKSKLLTKTLSTGIYYVSIAYQGNTQSGTLYPLFKVHSGHSYDDHYQWTSMTEHKSYCSCNGYITSSHVVSPDAYQNGNQYAICLLCNGFASYGGTWHDGIGSFPYTLNGSFILPNGVIVLEEADMEAYLNGTLVFINPNNDLTKAFITPYTRKRNDGKYD